MQSLPILMASRLADYAGAMHDARARTDSHIPAYCGVGGDPGGRVYLWLLSGMGYQHSLYLPDERCDNFGNEPPSRHNQVSFGSWRLYRQGIGLPKSNALVQTQNGTDPHLSYENEFLLVWSGVAGRTKSWIRRSLAPQR